MFVPLTTITLAELSSAELAQGTGLYNFFRQLGGSFGIAGIATLVARYTAQYRAVLAEHVTTPVVMVFSPSIEVEPFVHVPIHNMPVESPHKAIRSLSPML